MAEYVAAFPKKIKHKRKCQVDYTALPFGIPVRYEARSRDMAALKTGVSALRYWQDGELAQQDDYSGWTELHHYKGRAQGGDDMPENLIELTHDEHMAVHAGYLTITPAMMRQLNAGSRAAAAGIRIERLGERDWRIRER